MRRDDGPAIRDTLIWFAALIVSGGLGFWFWGSWAAVPFFLVYGVLYGSASDSRWHECGHRTAFKTKWMNDAVYRDRLLHDPARAGDLALEPYPPPHRHGDRRPRSGDHHAPPAGRSVALSQHLFAQERRDLLPQSVPARGRPADGGGNDLRARERAPEGLSNRAHLSGDLCAGHRRLHLFPLDSAGDVGRPSVALRRLAPALFRLHPASRSRRGRPRPPAQFAHRLHEPDLPVPLLEHELPRRASPVPADSVSRAAEAARGDQGGLPRALSEHHRRLSRDHPGAGAPAEGSDLLRAARTAGARRGLRLLALAPART